jgi:hypothetical protein
MEAFARSIRESDRISSNLAGNTPTTPTPSGVVSDSIASASISTHNTPAIDQGFNLQDPEAEIDYNEYYRVSHESAQDAPEAVERESFESFSARVNSMEDQISTHMNNASQAALEAIGNAGTYVSNSGNRLRLVDSAIRRAEWWGDLASYFSSLHPGQ